MVNESPQRLSQIAEIFAQCFGKRHGLAFFKSSFDLVANRLCFFEQLSAIQFAVSELMPDGEHLFHVFQDWVGTFSCQATGVFELVEVSNQMSPAQLAARDPQISWVRSEIRMPEKVEPKISSATFLDREAMA